MDIQEIDEQHKSLASLINELYNALATKQHHVQIAHIMGMDKKYAPHLTQARRKNDVA